MSLDSSSRSARSNSNSNSKTSLNSRNTNNDVSSINNKKRKKEGDGRQKTLGMAWGSNSRSSTFRASPFTDFGSYMAVKNRKLHEQFDAEASSSSHGGSGSKKPIFYGVSIFVDGYTIPSSLELRGYMLNHGGRFENYFSRQRVTHIICSNLPNSKVKNLRSFSRGLPVVKPTWVLDSVAANKLLSWVPYQLDQLASETIHQPKLSAFLALRSNPFSDDLKIGSISSEAHFFEICESTEDVKQHNGEFDALLHDSCDKTKFEEPTCSNSCEKEVAQARDVATNGILVERQPMYSPCRPSTSDSSHCLDNESIKKSSSMVTSSSNQGHSTLVDPNFVENYFKNSRLHFIGTWRNRYRKRFPNASGAFRPSSSINASFASQRNTICHVDMDCFFVSVVIRNQPELWDKPVAVCHSDNPRGTAEISSANYPARDYGVKAGIFVRDAKALCPHLVIIPYDFEAYEEVADQFYSILHKYCSKVQAMSCDEAFLDIADSEVDDPELLASVIRKEISAATGCTASVGISVNMLMARLATRTAKPDGQCYLPPEKVSEFLKELPIKVLPGIGRSLEEKLKKQHVKTCGELRMISKDSLQKEFGLKTGLMLWNYCRGIDGRLVGMIQESKSVGAEVNWGVRFKDREDSHHFLMSLCKEVSLRLQGCGVRGRTFTLKVKKRKTNEEPTKYMGCGDCDNLSHSLTVPMATDDVDVLQRIAAQLFGHFHIDVKDIRGIGLQVTKLESADSVKQGNERSSIRSWLVSASACTREKENRDMEEHIDDHLGHSTSTVNANLSKQQASLHRSSDVPPLSDLDMEVLEGLPPELLSEINDMYGGKLTSFLLEHKHERVDVDTSSLVHGNVEGARNGERASSRILAASKEVPIDDEGRQCETKELQLSPDSGARKLEVISDASALEYVGVMPSSLSQIDASVLKELPDEIRGDILELLPAHRGSESVSNAFLGPHDPAPQVSNHLDSSEIQVEQRDNDKLWFGNPPRWVEKFKFSECQILKVLAEMYSASRSSSNLSSVLLWSMSVTEPYIGGNTNESVDVVSCLCELLKQYVEMKIQLDIEEIYMCFCYLKRLSGKSELFLQVYNVTLPYLQETVGEKYGGNLDI